MFTIINIVTILLKKMKPLHNISALFFLADGMDNIIIKIQYVDVVFNSVCVSEDSLLCVV